MKSVVERVWQTHGILRDRFRIQLQIDRHGDKMLFRHLILFRISILPTKVNESSRMKTSSLNAVCVCVENDASRGLDSIY